MHRIKQQAKRNAWYAENNDGSPLHYNPFARYRSTRSGHSRTDVEGLRMNHTEPPLRRVHSELQEKTDSDFDAKPGLRHAATMPTGSARKDDDITPIAQSEKVSEVVEKSSRPESIVSESASDGDKTKAIPHFTAASQFRTAFLGSWLNILLVFIPIGFAVNYTHLEARVVFAMNFIAIVPSTVMISLAVEELSLRTGELIGALLNITFSNATQLISSILLLKSRQIVVLKTSLLGAIISNLLLMLGLCFFFGGINRMEQHYNITVAQMVAGMLFLAVISLVIPTASRLMADGVTDANVVTQSRGTSIVILISYGLYLFFQLKTHAVMFNQPSEKVPVKSKVVIVRQKLVLAEAQTKQQQLKSISEESDEDEDELEEPQLSLPVAIALLLVFTVLIGFNAEFATGSVQTMVQQAHISQTFVGFVIFPILSNDVLSIAMAVKDKMDLSIALTLERCMQTALLVVPLVVIVAWGMKVEEMSLDFDGFSVSATFASIIIVTYLIQDGKSNWLTGALLVKVYVIVVLAAYFVQS